MEKEHAFFNTVKKWLKCIGIAAIVIGILATIRILSLEFSAIRWTLLFFYWLFISSFIGNMGICTLSVIIELPMNYAVAGFLFGYGKINTLISDHWLGFLIYGLISLIVCVTADILNCKKQTS